MIGVERIFSDMCWCFRISCTLMANLFCRVTNELLDYVTSGCKQHDVIDDLYSVGDRESYYVKELRPNVRPLPSPPQKPKIETATYYRTVERLMAEDLLESRVDGSCIVRPYKEVTSPIKYVATIYAEKNFFHLHIRQTRTGQWTIGLEKPKEKLFDSPVDIINYYRLHKLLCTNKNMCISLVLVPIT